MSEQRSNGHIVSSLTVHIVWSTKYRYSVLIGEIKIRRRTLLRQIVEAEDMERGNIQQSRSYASKLSSVPIS